MTTLAELQRALENPNARKMLNLIAASEGVKHGYNTLFGNQQFNNLGAHPNIRKEFTQTDGRKNYTTAAGRYQFLNDTWAGLRNQYGFRDFSPQNQDLGAIALISGRGALNDVLKGDYRSAILKLGPEWASLPSSTYKQGKRSWDFVNKQLGRDVGGARQTQQSKQQFSPNFIDLKSVGIQQQNKEYQPQMVDLEAVGIGNSKQNNSFQPELIDLKSVGIG
ncbi:glycoside hydrolase family 24 protein [Acinetobacter silvestris]|uniref:Lysozyme n=1 Tax=Acinetobacter silvestris TaxID=1977882 RepID=A0A1Y3CFG0_9GAMM|nr:glycoside hydrolase family 104 protein [Acinetobacter silvestris]OTG65841.1 lysozyme [Acinetobacter silvestris]